MFKNSSYIKLHKTNFQGVVLKEYETLQNTSTTYTKIVGKEFVQANCRLCKYQLFDIQITIRIYFEILTEER